MSLQQEIQRIFGERCFERPIFYNNPGGLRFELAESGNAIDRFVTALSKAMIVCRDVFEDQTHVLVCLREHSTYARISARETVKALRDVDIEAPRERSIWREPIAASEWFDEDRPEYWINIAFAVPLKHLQTLLWFALASDSSIQPNPSCQLYLFNLQEQLMVWPYDDRGMDVVGPHHARLRQLYQRHNALLLDYDREQMDAVFADSQA